MSPNNPRSLVFDEIAISYATHLRELEAARLRFEQQCDEATLVLLEVTDSLARAASLTVADKSSATSKKSGAGPYGNIWVRGAFAKATSQEKGSAISFGLGHGDFWGDGTHVPFGLYPYLSFTTPKVKPIHRRIEANLHTVCPPAAEVRSGGGGVYLVGPYVEPAAGFLGIENVEEAIGRLVRAFITADEWMADAARTQD